MHSYKDLIIWQKSILLIEKIYELTRVFPKEELYGLTNQIRRAAVSVASNIAEGQSRGSLKEYIQFLTISFGSIAEVDTQLYIAMKIDYINEKQYQEIYLLLLEIQKMTHVLIYKLKNKNL
ncbi:four helix bundle protein [Candidatus Gottesmanbacteria bacterium RIFCSPHIGHO2_02_FULL_39_11]|uniref:Four helix bundle protein n=1 Tax=Candidatus Gottesmanbacteria bacterium RIFCSPHIGHO2_02_FULL_39_11 TaxID=1798382 RepID=A0A1F5ZL68_9BACT|nr:MAG: four helix bundle protein [Candidatus Gottesmanbacteria bacterium RIFCSPHIGHO2_02_FULL_39_11]